MPDPRRHIGVVTSARSDFGLLAPLMRAIRDDADLTLSVLATGMHFSRRHGYTVDEIRETHFADELIEVPSAGADDSPGAVAATMARGIAGFAEVFQQGTLTLLVIMGDRFDALPAALAALPFNLPVAHISGGDVTVGAIDDSVRHALTKLSHLHFPAHQTSARRIIQMGEEPWRVTTVGEPGLDALRDFPFEDRETVFGGLGLDVDRPVSVFTYHPETLDPEGSKGAITAILAAADGIESQIVFTYPNTDTGSAAIIDAIEAYCRRRSDCQVHASLGRERYLNLLHSADCMVGNSSSGIVEAPSFELPVVNIGDRQRGRIISANIVNASTDTQAVARAWEKALDQAFRRKLSGLTNPYGDGHAVERILGRLKTVDLDRRLVAKAFHDLAGAEDLGAALSRPDGPFDG